MTTKEKIRWAEQQLTPVKIKSITGKVCYFKLIPARTKTEVANSAIAKLTEQSRQNVHLQK